MKKLAMLLVAMVLMACGGVTGPDTSEIPGYYAIYFCTEFGLAPRVPVYVHAGDLVLHDDRTLEICLYTSIWDGCQDDEGEGAWHLGQGTRVGRHTRMRNLSGLQICSDPSIASTFWLSGLKAQDETCLTFFWEEYYWEGELMSDRWDTRDLDPEPGVERWLSIRRERTIATEEE